MQLQEALTELTGKSEELVAGSAGVLSAPEQIQASLASGSEQVSQIYETLESLKTENSNGAAYLRGIAEQATSIYGKLDPETKKLAQALAAGAQEVAEGSSSVAQGNSALAENAKQLKSGTSGLADGIRSADQGAGQLADGASTLYNGTSDLVDGVQELADGVDDLKDGTREFMDKTEDMNDEIDDAIDDLIREIDDSDFVPISVASSENTEIGLVQFAMKTEGIAIEEEEESETEAVQETSVMEKLKCHRAISFILFRGKVFILFTFPHYYPH